MEMAEKIIGSLIYGDHPIPKRGRAWKDRLKVPVAIGLVWVGDQLGLDLTTAVVVVFGIRIFQNLAAIRRRVFGG